MKKQFKKLEETVTVKLRNKWQNISMRLFDRMLHRNQLIWSNRNGCFVGLTSK